MGLTPAERAAHLDMLAAQSRADHWQRSAVPARTGVLSEDLAAAAEAVQRVEAEWDAVDMEAKRLRSRAGSFPTGEDLVEVSRAERRAAELWQLYQAAVRNRDQLEAGARWEPLDRMPGWSR